MKCDGRLGDVEKAIIVAYTGTSVSFKCEGNNDTLWLYTHRQVLNSYMDGRIVVFTIRRVSEKDQGTYYCLTTQNVDRRREEWVNPVTLYVAGNKVASIDRIFKLI